MGYPIPPPPSEIRGGPHTWPTAIENTPAAWDARADAATSAGAGLQGEFGQTQRFLAALRHLDLAPKCSLLDFGCGTGRLAEFVPASVEYLGYDWSLALTLRAAREHSTRPFTSDRPIGRFDHVVAIGPFNLADGHSREQTFETIAELWAQTRRTLVVSLLRQPTPPKPDDPSVLRYDPVAVACWALELGVARWELDCGYLDNDMLLVLRRQ